jgi:capping protein alpha
MASKTTALSDFIASAPPGELSNVITGTHLASKTMNRHPTNWSPAIKTLSGDANITSTLEPALQKYNEEQFTAVKLPGASSTVVISPYNRLEDGRYFDSESRSSWEFDHVTQVSRGREHGMGAGANYGR